MKWFTRRNAELAAGMVVAAGLTAGALIAGTAHADEAEVGAQAPDFYAMDTTVAGFSLSDYADQVVVLEWVNPGCPYVQKHYQTGNMPGLQSEAEADDVVWITINSTHENHQDFRNVAGMNAFYAENDAAPTRTVLDVSGTIGHLYGAQTTPHMYVIDHGVLKYAGAIDDRPTARHSDVEGATNYVRDALSAVAAGEAVDPAETKSYGCTIKYGS